MTDESRRSTARLDPRNPLVINTHELGRRPGSMRTLSRSVPAPSDLGVDVLGVPQGSPIDLDLRLESVMEGVLVSATAHTEVTGECVRCLDPIARSLEVTLQELYAYPGHERDDADDETELPVLVGDLINLEPVLRDAVVLALPLQPLCRDDCPGLCSECGAKLADDPEHGHESADPRWAALQGLLDTKTEET
ncbi:MAG: YceD family protein [Actinomycetes bacterium]